MMKSTAALVGSSVCTDENEWPPLSSQQLQSQQHELQAQRKETPDGVVDEVTTFGESDGSNWEMLIDDSTIIANKDDTAVSNSIGSVINSNSINDNDNNKVEIFEKEMVVVSEQQQHHYHYRDSTKETNEGDVIMSDESYDQVDGCDADDTIRVMNDDETDADDDDVVVLDNEEDDAIEDTNRRTNVAGCRTNHPLRRSRGNSISSPDLRNLQIYAMESEYDDDDNNDFEEDYYDCAETSPTTADSSPAAITFSEDLDTTSYSIISSNHLDHGSVVSLSTSASLTGICNSIKSSGLSFRDILLRTAATHLHPTTNCQQEENIKKICPPPRSSIMSKTRFVVVPTQKLTVTNDNSNGTMKRSAYSTNDLQSLDTRRGQQVDFHTSNATNDCDDDYNNNGGGSGVEFYYNHKSMGAKGHVNGLKLRPDEMKRREMIVYKKNLQRQQQQQQQGGGGRKSKK